MNTSVRILVIVAVLLVGATVQAQTVNWKYAEVGWATLDPDDASREDGWFVGGSGDLGNLPLHIFGEFADLGPIDVWQLGVGWHGLFGERADLFADGAFYDADFDDGFRVRFGVRWMVTRRIEINGHLSWLELNFSDAKSVAANAIFDFSKRFGVGGGLEGGDEFNTARVFLRFNFGPRG